ncbi:unnamed protein product [Pieris brassicae]|uniref:Uncharacterized protein n=1 Tax=Pieris brassicae TaxID=7116 RepID=A0A9P0TA49_PIEBR|nr:unnamed protein product [Pieris brassicae]
MCWPRGHTCLTSTLHISGEILSLQVLTSRVLHKARVRVMRMKFRRQNKDEKTTCAVIHGILLVICDLEQRFEQLSQQLLSHLNNTFYNSYAAPFSMFNKVTESN